MALSDLQVFQEYVYDSYQPLLDYNFQMFNEATQGGFTLVPGSMQGDYLTTAIWNRLSGMVKRRNPYTNGAQAAVQLGMSNMSKVKVAAGTPPIDITPSFMTWLKKDPEEFAAYIAKQLAEDTIADMLDIACGAYAAATTAVGATLVYDGTAGTGTLTGLLATAKLFGDQSQNIKCWVMHSKTAFDIYGVALANATNLFKFGDVMVMQDGFGRPFVVTDTPGLTYVSTGTKYHVLGLTPGAVVIEQNNDFLDNIQTSNLTENITRTYQAEWTFNVGMKGYSWDTVNGGHAPTTAALKTGTNWDRVTQIPLKLTAGVMANFA